MSRQPQDESNNYVECTECGHPIEEHGLGGCEVNRDERCPCLVKWTKAAIRECRVAVGLPASYRWLSG
jgi:hypothetical protein